MDSGFSKIVVTLALSIGFIAGVITSKLLWSRKSDLEDEDDCDIVVKQSCRKTKYGPMKEQIPPNSEDVPTTAFLYYPQRTTERVERLDVVTQWAPNQMLLKPWNASMYVKDVNLHVVVIPKHAEEPAMPYLNVEQLCTFPRQETQEQQKQNKAFQDLKDIIKMETEYQELKKSGADMTQHDLKTIRFMRELQKEADSETSPDILSVKEAWKEALKKQSEKELKLKESLKEEVKAEENQTSSTVADTTPSLVPQQLESDPIVVSYVEDPSSPQVTMEEVTISDAVQNAGEHSLQSVEMPDTKSTVVLLAELKKDEQNEEHAESHTEEHAESQNEEHAESQNDEHTKAQNEESRSL